MVQFMVRLSLKRTEDVSAMACAAMAAARAAIREVGVDHDPHPCGEGNPAYDGDLPCILPDGHHGSHESCTGEPFEVAVLQEV